MSKDATNGMSETANAPQPMSMADIKLIDGTLWAIRTDMEIYPEPNEQRVLRWLTDIDALRQCLPLPDAERMK